MIFLLNLSTLKRMKKLGCLIEGKLLKFETNKLKSLRGHVELA